MFGVMETNLRNRLSIQLTERLSGEREMMVPWGEQADPARPHKPPFHEFFECDLPNTVWLSKVFNGPPVARAYWARASDGSFVGCGVQLVDESHPDYWIVTLVKREDHRASYDTWFHEEIERMARNLESQSEA